MKPFAVFIFEINCYETEPFVKIQLSKGYEWGRKPPKASQATIWLHVTTDSTWKTRIAADMKQCCTKLCGPVSWEIADETLLRLKVSFEALNIEHFEQTCSDD